MINHFQDNSCVTPISGGVNLSTDFRGSLRAVPPVASLGTPHFLGH
ncbi:hypothetical protein SH449x_004864 [Pirellulaceae bacterium SH449]